MVKNGDRDIWAFDSHAHLQDPRFAEDVDEVINRAIEGGVGMMICVGYDVESSKQAVFLASRHRQVYAVVGIHPHDADTADDEAWQELIKLAGHPKVVAIGETGLDYYRNLSGKEEQREAFLAQLRIARELGKPVVIHDREAHEEVRQIVKKEKAGRFGGVMHCYSGHLPLALDLMKEGFYISFAGPLTYPNNKKSVEVAAKITLDRILVETDCPYLTPVPYRGKRNEPLFVKEVVAKLAQLRGKSYEEMAYITSFNARKVFGIP